MSIAIRGGVKRVWDGSSLLRSDRYYRCHDCAEVTRNAGVPSRFRPLQHQ